MCLILKIIRNQPYSSPIVYSVFKCKYCNCRVSLDINEKSSDLIPDCISDDEKIIKDILE